MKSDLQVIPGIGKNMAQHLINAGYPTVESLKKQDPEEIYLKDCVNMDTQGVAALVEGMDIDEAIRRMEGIRCGFKSTSCPDQLATALKQYKAQN